MLAKKFEQEGKKQVTRLVFSKFVDFKSKETFLKKNHIIKVSNKINLLSQISILLGKQTVVIVITTFEVHDGNITAF